ncbi:MAG: flavodoxin family protein [Candidatus Hodarchaeales archaeon]
MQVQILGISGSPIPNSNTDRAVMAVLNSSGLETEFVKLSDINVGPCRACRECVTDNVCKKPDDFPELAKKVKEADALVIGAYCPYSNIDAYTKAFLERLWSMRHVKNLNRGKLVGIIVTGLVPRANGHKRRNLLLKFLKPYIKPQLPANSVVKSIEREMKMERMRIIGSIKVKGNVPCLICGNGDECVMSGVPIIFGKGTKSSSDLCINVEDDLSTWLELQEMGKKLREQLTRDI